MLVQSGIAFVRLQALGASHVGIAWMEVSPVVSGNTSFSGPSVGSTLDVCLPPPYRFLNKPPDLASVLERRVCYALLGPSHTESIAFVG